MERGWHHNGAQGEDLRVLPGALSRRHRIHPLGSALPLLHLQPHLPLHPHLPHLLSRLLPACGIRGEGELGTDHPSRTHRLSLGHRRNPSSDPGLHSTSR